jgi:6-phosphofructokinase 1
MARKVAMLTGGGDCPGLNAVIRAVTRKLTADGDYEMVGVEEGWRGLMENNYMPLDISNTADILPRGGTILRTSRTNPYKEEGGPEKVVQNLSDNDIYALVAIGGDDTLGVARKLYDDHGINVVGVPKTIDNDLSATDYCFGFNTAVQIATEAVDRLHTTAASHNRCIVAEIMGRHTGWITIMTGIAASADVVLIPEVEMTIEEVCAILKRNRDGGRNYNIVAVSEGFTITSEKGEEGLALKSEKVDDFGHVQLGGVAERLAKQIEERTGYETRATVLGHIQRGGTPTAYDRILATRYGLGAADLVLQEKFGRMVALQGDDIVDASLSAATDELKVVKPEFWEVARTFFG